MTNKIVKVSIAGASSIFILVVLEIAIRVYGWAPMPSGYAGKTYSDVEKGRIECMNPEVSRSYYNQLTNLYPGCVFYSVNNLGFRNNFDVDLKKSSMTKRIAAIGDSFTFGFGVLEEDTFLTKLQLYYQDKGENVEVINAARPAAGLVEYKKILNDNVSPVSPDILLVGININDVTIFPTNLIIENISKKYDYKIRRYVKLLDFLFYSMEKNESAKINIKNIVDTYTPERQKEFKDFVTVLKDYGQKKGVKVFVMIHPVYYDFKHYAFQSIHNDLDKILEEEKIAHYDFLDDFKNQDAKKFWITKNDQHPNELAHQIYFEGLRKIGFVK